jgi:hypothetical protein
MYDLLKVRKKTTNVQLSEQSTSYDAGLSLSDELHQAMQDITITNICRADSPVIEAASNIKTECHVPSPEPCDNYDQVEAQLAVETSEHLPDTDVQTKILETNPCTDHCIGQAAEIEQTDLYFNTENQRLIFEVTASAPPLSIGTENPVSITVPQTVSTDLNKSYLNNEVLIAIKPFTETQLAALYYNHEIDFSKEYVKEFVESQKSLQNYKFYEIISTYLRARNKLIATQLEVDNLRKECRTQEEQIWSISDTVVNESGKCQDGNTVSVVHKYPVASMNRQSLTLLGRSLTSVRDLLSEVFTLHAYSCEVLRLQIEHYVQEVLSYYCNIPHNTPVQLLPSCKLQKKDLYICISVLFEFQRHHINDEQFLCDTREWLLRLGAMLLRVATASDHLFLLHHVLRSPGGISSWAIPLIQIPLEDLTNSYPSTSSAFLDHAITFLSVLMNPIYEREKVISDRRSLEDPWTFLDSDGDEEDESRRYMALLENDLVAILNQLPIDSVFRHVLGIQRRDNSEFYCPEHISQSSLLQLFAFATTIIQLLRTGLQTYNTPRYRQFAKRLGRLVRHTVQYVSDQWEVYRNSPADVHDAAMLARLQVNIYKLCILHTVKWGNFDKGDFRAFGYLVLKP